MMVLKPTNSESKNMILGNFCLIGNCICASTFILLQKKYIFINSSDGSIISKYPPIFVTAISYGFGMISMVICSAFYAIYNISAFEVKTTWLLPIAYAVISFFFK